MILKKIPALLSVCTLSLFVLSGCSGPSDDSLAEAPATRPAEASATFSWFEYQGRDPVFEEPLEPGQFQNPILAGFYPDPSITRVGEYYYLVHSSFAFSPGVPIFRSQDMVNWQSLGHVLINADQLPLENQQTSRGVYAPTLRHHEGVFYLITTLVDVRGNFIVTATDPAGPWSDPILLPEVGGIDPDIFFDDDGRVYIAHNDGPDGEPLYEGHRAIRLWEFDLENKKIIPESGRVIVNGGVDISKEPIWIEAPHIFKKDGWYYLTCAEGGTGYDHSQVIFRTRHLDEPFVPFERNPILTQRDLDMERANPITTAGHADLVETADGEWWAVFLATRAYDKTLYNTGRETFLLPVRWEDEWPIILDPQTGIPWRLNKPAAPENTLKTEPFTGNFTWRDEFRGAALQHHWNILRQPEHSWYTAGGDSGGLTMTARPTTLGELAQPSFIGRRQQHMHFSASTELRIPENTTVSAGLTVFQGEKFHFFLGIAEGDDGHIIFIEAANNSEPRIVQRLPLGQLTAGQPIVLGTHGDAGEISFYYQFSGQEKIMVAEKLDARLLSTGVSGGFVGTHIGLHARTATEIR